MSIDEVVINFDEGSLWIMNIALAIIMFGVALGITLDDFHQLYRFPKAVLVGLTSQFILLPLLTFCLIVVINPIPSIALGMILVASCPGGNISNFMTHLAKGNSALSVSMTAISTFIAIIMTPFNLKFYGGLFTPTASILNEVELDFLTLFKLVTLILGVPLLIGMFVRSMNQTLADRISKFIKPLSIMFFILIVVVALFNNFEIFQIYIMYVLSIGVVHNILAILLGFYLAKLLGLPFKDQKTLAIETGIQNSGLGLLLIFTFFEGLGGMAILTAFWGIWHIVSGLAISIYWSKIEKV